MVKSVQASAKSSESDIYPGEVVIKPNNRYYFNFLVCNGYVGKKGYYPNLYNAIGDKYLYSVIQGGGFPWKNQSTFNSNTSTTIAWNSGTALPSALYNHEAVVTKNYAYIIGGNTGSIMSTVYQSPIDSTGTLGSWTSVSSLPIAIQSMTCVAYNNFLYCIGGETSTTTQVTNVYRAPINADGTLGTWSQDSSLSMPISRSKAIVTKNRIYLIGGYSSGSYRQYVQTAPINPDGTLGVWIVINQLPQVTGLNSCITYKNRVYIVQNYKTVADARVYYCYGSDDGYLESWNTGQYSCVNDVMYSEVVSNNNFAIVIGGQNKAGTVLSNVYILTINSDGSLGGSTTSTSLPAAMYGHKAIVTSSKIYVLGGYNTAALNTVYYTNYNGGSNDYSYYYSNSYRPTYLASDDFCLPDYSNVQLPLSSHSYYIKTT